MDVAGINCKALVGETFVAIEQVDDATVVEAMLEKEVSHYLVVAVGIDAQVRDA